jgi:RNA polymerase sigma factor (sigma-70 family)
VPSRVALRSLTDAQLIGLCLVKHAPAWDTLIDRYAALIFTTARRMGMRDADAEDVFQEVSVLLYEHLSDLRETTRLPGWLVTTSRRAVLQRFRRKQFPSFTDAASEDWIIEEALPLGKERVPSPEESVLEIEQQWLVRAGLERLTPNCQQLLQLLYLRDPPAPYAEAAQTLKMPVNSISPNRSRCLQRLKEILEESDG